MLEKQNLFEHSENAILVGVIHNNQTEQQVAEYMAELAFLAETAGAVTDKKIVQRLQHPDSKTYVGKGKLEEIKKYAAGRNIGLLIFDDELSGSQIGNIQEAVGIKTIDRSDLILDIFARRAKTAQAKAQVELAQYQYILPRLRGMWKHLERLGGGIGTRGPGETEIETDRRIVRDKITLLRKRLLDIERQAFTQRKERGAFIRVALVGYTNVGKSTLMNLLSKSEVLAENKLFATLDTTTRKLVFENTPFLLSDTVGFIRKLPHHLIESFKSTLDEVKESDILMHVVDVSHPQYEDQMKVVNTTLAELGCSDKPMITVFNKMDLYEEQSFDQWLEPDVKAGLLDDLRKRWENETKGNCVFISAVERRAIDILRTTMLAMIRESYVKRYPYKTGFQQQDYGA
ncbi:MAG: GTPase HflX [Chitinophagaceae bacterium]|nr:MAG: GTPase HflX [Chitinophagaceae bacterium]